MDTEIRKIALLPRYSTYAGARSYRTVPILVRDYSYVIVGAWRGPVIGSASPTVTVSVETSDDLENWTGLGSFDPSPEYRSRFDLAAEWMRLLVVLTGTDPAVTCWAVGDFATRTPRDHGGAS